MTPSGVSHFLVRWEQSFEQGRDLAAHQLCPEHPHLADDLARGIEVLRALRKRLADGPPTRPFDPSDDHLAPDTVATPLTDERSAGTEPPPHRAANRFHAVRPLAEGGLGQVFLATDLELHREVALKEIRGPLADDRDLRARFVFEAQVTGKLEHPGVVPVYGLGCYADGRPYYAMRFIRGESLHAAGARFHASQPAGAPLALGMPLRELLSRFVAVCNTIAYAHSRGVIHRDLKPANIMLGDYGETLVVDWGLAKAMTPDLVRHVCGEPAAAAGPADGTAHETVAGHAIGTPQFMSPEQAAGDLDRIGPASDIYSLGATLYYLLTGLPPFEDTDDATLSTRGQSGAVVPPSQLKRELPAALEAICLKSMAARPADRYASARDLAADVERWLADEPVSARRETAYERLLRWLRRHRSWVVSIGWALMMGLGVLGVAVVLLNSAYEDEKKARDEEREARREAERSRQRAEEAFRAAREAVGTSFTRVSEDGLLNQPGMQPLRKRLLEDALGYYRRFLAERGDDPSLRKEYADAHFREGRILELTGPPAAAIPSYEKALAIQRELAAGDDPAPEILAALGDTLNALGRTRHKTNRYDDALKLYQESASVRRRLADLKPREAAYGRALANAWMNIGLAYKDKGEPPQARKYLANAQALRAELRERDPSTALLRETAMGDYNLGLLELSRRDEKAADAAFRAALAGYDAVAAAEPNDLNSRYMLSVCCRSLGDLTVLPGREKESQQMYERAWSLLDALALRNPDVPAYQTAKAELLLNFGGRHFQANRLDESWKELEKAAAIYEALPPQQRDAARSVRDLAVCWRIQAEILSKRGKTADARKLLERSRDRLEGLAKAFPKDADYAAQLAQTRALLARLPAP